MLSTGTYRKVYHKQLWSPDFDSDTPLPANIADPDLVRYNIARSQIRLWKVLKQREPLKVHKNENFFGFDFELCTISLLVMNK